MDNCENVFINQTLSYFLLMRREQMFVQNNPRSKLAEKKRGSLLKTIGGEGAEIMNLIDLTTCLTNIYLPLI